MSDNGGLTKLQGWIIIYLLFAIIFFGFNDWQFPDLTHGEPKPINWEGLALVISIFGVFLFWAGVAGYSIQNWERVKGWLETVESLWLRWEVMGLVNIIFWGTLIFLVRPSGVWITVQTFLVLCITVANGWALYVHKQRNRQREDAEGLVL